MVRYTNEQVISNARFLYSVKRTKAHLKYQLGNTIWEVYLLTCLFYRVATAMEKMWIEGSGR